MEKKIKTILASVIVIVIIVSALLHLFVFRDDKNKFIGTWEQIEATIPGLTDPEF